MSISAIRGRIARRVLINLRMKPELAKSFLPAGFEPRIIDGYAIAGICLIRLEQVRLPFMPAAFGAASENAAIRFSCVRKDEHGAEHDVVYLARRDTSSPVNAMLGRGCFPAHLHPAKFEVTDNGDDVQIEIRSRDGKADLSLKVQVTDRIDEKSVFASTTELSEFFRLSNVGYSPKRPSGASLQCGQSSSLDAVELQTDTWDGLPLAVEHFHSSFFSDPAVFHAGDVELDSAFLMRNIEHSWRKVPEPQRQIDRCCG